MKQICVLGLGYIGLPTSSMLATKGFNVLGVDVNPKVVETINKGKIHITEPDLDLFVITGDGDCCAIGVGHWVHAIRYNMKMVVMLFDNNVYGLTKIKFSTYLLVTLPCMIPGTIAFNFAAGSAREVILSGGQPEAVKRTIIYLAIAAVAFVLVSLIPGWVKKRFATEEVSPEG